MSKDFNKFITRIPDDDKPDENIIKFLQEIDRYLGGAPYKRLHEIIPNHHTLKFHIDAGKHAGLVTETEIEGGRIFENTALGKDILKMSSEYPWEEDFGSPDVSEVRIRQSAEENILFNAVYDNPEETLRGSLYGHIDIVRGGRVVVEIVDAETGDEVDGGHQKTDLDVVGFYRSEWPVGYLLHQDDIDHLFSNYGHEHLVIMCIESKETGESAYSFWGVNTERGSRQYFPIPHEVIMDE